MRATAEMKERAQLAHDRSSNPVDVDAIADAVVEPYEITSFVLSETGKIAVTDGRARIAAFAEGRDEALDPLVLIRRVEQLIAELDRGTRALVPSATDSVPKTLHAQELTFRDMRIAELALAEEQANNQIERERKRVAELEAQLQVQAQHIRLLELTTGPDPDPGPEPERDLSPETIRELNADDAEGWRAVGDGAFAMPFGTIRVCRVCGCLVAGGPTACVRCAEQPTPEQLTAQQEWAVVDARKIWERRIAIGYHRPNGPKYGTEAELLHAALVECFPRSAPADTITVNGGAKLTWREYSEYQRHEYGRLRDRDLAEIKALQKRCQKAEAKRAPAAVELLSEGDLYMVEHARRHGGDDYREWVKLVDRLAPAPVAEPRTPDELSRLILEVYEDDTVEFFEAVHELAALAKANGAQP